MMNGYSLAKVQYPITNIYILNCNIHVWEGTTIENFALSIS